MGSTAPPAAASPMCTPIPPDAMAPTALPRRKLCTCTSILFRPWSVAVLAFILAALLPVTAAAATGPSPIASNSFSMPAATPSPGAAAIFIRDSRVPVKQKDHWVFLSEAEVEDLRKRSDTATETSTSTTKTSSKTGTGTTITRVTTATSTKTSTAATWTSALPEFFDSSLASNFSSSGNCPAFIKAFLANSTFTKKCYPFSLLLQVRAKPTLVRTPVTMY